MTTLEERIAEEIADTWTGTSYPPPREIARAVVAVLPTSDVSDDDIEAALSVDLSAFPDFGAINRALVANVRALLDAQAAAHAAEVGEWRAVAKRAVDRETQAVQDAEADRDAYRARIDKVRALCDAYTDPDEHYINLGVLRAALAGDA